MDERTTERTADEHAITYSILELEREIMQNQHTPQRKYQSWAAEISLAFARVIVESIRVLQVDEPRVDELAIATMNVASHLAATRAFLASLDLENEIGRAHV